MEFRILIKSLVVVVVLATALLSCTKEVDIDIPGFEEQLVIDGRIETGLPPIVLLSKSKEVFASTDLDAFLNGFVTGATVTVSNGITTVELIEFCTDDLVPGSVEAEVAAGILGIPADTLVLYHICAYTTLDPAMFGQVGKTYILTVSYEGKSYSAATKLMPPTPLDQVFWKKDADYTTQGFSWATLSDPPGQFDAYMWEVKRLNGPESDGTFKKTYSPVIDDEFFDGMTFDFWYENPFNNDDNLPDSVRWHYAIGDTVVIKSSKMDRDVYEFYEKKYMQLQTGGNPFATPTNIPSNISGGALGVWSGFSPSIDTLVCTP